MGTDWRDESTLLCKKLVKGVISDSGDRVAGAVAEEEPSLSPSVLKTRTELWEEPLWTGVG